MPMMMMYVSDEVVSQVTLVNVVILSCVISLFGMATNVVNAVVFTRQGFRESINVSLCALAVSDFLSLLTLFWISVCYSPLLANARDVTFLSMEVEIVTGGIPHVIAINATSWLTALVTLERCVCIAFPLKVKDILTPRRTKFLVVAIFIFVIACEIPTFYTVRLGWKYVPDRNRTMYGAIFLPGADVLNEIKYYTVNVFGPTTTFTIVIVCTTVLIVKLNQKTKWRQRTTSTKVTSSATKSITAISSIDSGVGDATPPYSNSATTGGSTTGAATAATTTVVVATAAAAAAVTNVSSSSRDAATLRDRKVVKMVITVAVIFILSFTPTVIIFFLMAREPEFRIAGKYHNNFMVTLDFALLIEAINGSVNIFIYYNMSSRYKMVFRALFFGDKAMA